MSTVAAASVSSLSSYGFEVRLENAHSWYKVFPLFYVPVSGIRSVLKILKMENFW